MAKRILILGASGFLGTYIKEHLDNAGHVVVGTYCSRPARQLIHLDLLDSSRIDDVLLGFEPDSIIFLSGTKDVARCERDVAYATDVNFNVVRNLVAACDRTQCLPQVIFLSTDYVFDGQRGHYTSGDKVGASTVYGMTNIIAERLLLSSIPHSHIVRVSAVMGMRGGFFQWLWQKLEKDEPVELFENTYFSPTSIGRLCEFIKKTVSGGQEGGQPISHLSDGFRFSRYAFGIAVARALGKPESLIKPGTADFSNSYFQPDISLLPDGIDQFENEAAWNELGRIY